MTASIVGRVQCGVTSLDKLLQFASKVHTKGQSSVVSIL